MPMELSLTAEGEAIIRYISIRIELVDMLVDDAWRTSAGAVVARCLGAGPLAAYVRLRMTEFSFLQITLCGFRTRTASFTSSSSKLFLWEGAPGVHELSPP